MARALITIAALGAVACAGITGLGDYEIVDQPTAALDGGGPPITLDGGITLSTTSLAFPEARCGETKTLPLVITNTSAAEVPLSITPPANVTVEGATPSVPPGKSVTLVVGTTGAKNGVIHLSFGAQIFDVAFTTSFHGPELAVETPTVDFGEIRHDMASAAQPVAFRNDGDADVRVTGLGAGSDFALAAPVVVPAHGKASGNVTMTAGPAGDPITANAALTTDTPVCNGVPALVLEGRRSPTDVTVSATNLELICTAGLPPPPVTVSNYGSRKVQLEVKPQASLSVSPTSFELDVGTKETPTSITFNSNINNTQPADYVYDLVITEGELPARTVSVHNKLIGAVLAYDTNVDTHTMLGTTAVIPAKNTGNVPVCIHYTVQNAGGGDTPPGLEPDEAFAPNADGDIKITIPAVYSRPDARIRPSAVACPGASAPAPVCKPMNDVQVKVDH